MLYWSAHLEVFLGELVVELVGLDGLHVDFEVLLEVLPVLVGDFARLALVLGLFEVVEQVDRGGVLQAALVLELRQVLCSALPLSNLLCLKNLNWKSACASALALNSDSAASPGSAPPGEAWLALSDFCSIFFLKE